MISVIVPAFNEEESLTETVKKIDKTILEDHEILVVDDGSTDKTGAIADSLRNRRIRVFHHKTNKGCGAAWKTGLQNAKGDIILTLDCDLSYPLDDYQEMVKKLRTYDMVIAYPKGIRGSWSRLVISKIGSLIYSLFFGVRVHSTSCAFRVFKKDLLKLPVKSDSFEIATEQVILAQLYGYKVGEHPSMYVGRRKGYSKFNYRKEIPRNLYLLVRMLLYRIRYLFQ